jgi:CRISPR-associated endonuclease Csy4
MNRFFVSIRFLPEERDDAFLAGRCICILHGFIKRYEINSIGVSFPCWSMDSVGREIAFVSTSADFLSILIKQPYFLEMEQRGFFSLSQPCLVNEKNNQEAYFMRNQRIGKLFPGRLKRDVQRAKRRAKERGETYSPQHLTLPADIKDIHFHQVPLHSGSSNRDFYLYIQRENVEQPNGSFGFNTYGLSGAVEQKTPVPFIF